MNLIENLTGYLLGLETRPKWIVSAGAELQEVSRRICEHWWERWAAPRMKNEQAMERMASHTLLHPIEHGARVRMPEHDLWQMKMF